MSAKSIAFAILLVVAAGSSQLCGDETGPALRGEAVAAMRKAAAYYRGQVASHGGYVYYYSLDLKRRWGEGEATLDQIFVQPPGTPTVGMAYLRAHEATGDRFYLEAATDAAEALIYGQLQSGGWTQTVDFDPRGSKVAQYRNGKGKGRNSSSLDDGQTQSAIQFLVHADQAHGFKHAAIHEGAQIALDALLAAQFPNGAFPQVWTGPVPPQQVVKANYPDYDWRTEGRIKNYWDMYTLNDGLAGTMAETLLEAHRVYKDSKYLAALSRLGDFLLLAQMPEPQPVWAQQYNYPMQPIWARRFEPAAITGGESQDVLETLMVVHRATGDAKYLAPFPAALSYLKRSQLPDGRLARYYELKTNRPLYMTRRGDEYSLTYDDSNLPDHYGWKVASRLEEIEKEYTALKSGAAPTAQAGSSDLRTQVQQILSELDEQGRWISMYSGERLVGQPKFAPGFQYLSSAVFSRNLEQLSKFVAESK
jgi:PelA/Pel-15E family pectate lyase